MESAARQSMQFEVMDRHGLRPRDDEEGACDAEEGACDDVDDACYDEEGARDDYASFSGGKAASMR